MKIKNYTRQKNSQYKIRLEDDSYILVHEELILKYELLIKKEITDDLKNILYEENKKYLVYDEALKYLSRKMRSKYEIEKYLNKKDYTEDIIKDAIKLLEQQGYLNDYDYATFYVHDKIALSNEGPEKIKKELKSYFIKEEYIKKAINVFTKEIEEERIIKLINKAIKTNHTKGKSYLKQKVLNDLNNLGYHKDIILNNLYLIDDIDDSNIRQKEYDKLYSKFSKKYSGYELEYKIKQALYRKGL